MRLSQILLVFLSLSLAGPAMATTRGTKVKSGATSKAQNLKKKAIASSRRVNKKPAANRVRLKTQKSAQTKPGAEIVSRAGNGFFGEVASTRITSLKAPKPWGYTFGDGTTEVLATKGTVTMKDGSKAKVLVARHGDRERVITTHQAPRTIKGSRIRTLMSILTNRGSLDLQTEPVFKALRESASAREELLISKSGNTIREIYTGRLDNGLGYRLIFTQFKGKSPENVSIEIHGDINNRQIGDLNASVRGRLGEPLKMTSPYQALSGQDVFTRKISWEKLLGSHN